MSIASEILHYVNKNPGCNYRQVADSIPGVNISTVNRCMSRFFDEGKLARELLESSLAYYPIGAGIERLARDFSVELTRQWPGENGDGSLRPKVKNGDKVEVLIGSDLVITGWVAGYAEYTVTLPVPYTSKDNFVVTATCNGGLEPGDGARTFVEALNTGPGTFTLVCLNANGVRSPRAVSWIAEGKI